MKKFILSALEVTNKENDGCLDQKTRGYYAYHDVRAALLDGYIELKEAKGTAGGDIEMSNTNDLNTFESDSEDGDEDSSLGQTLGSATHGDWSYSTEDEMADADWEPEEEDSSDLA